MTPTNYQKAFEEGRADIYRACEWGQIRRSYDNPEGPIVARRPAMVYQGVYVRPDSPIEAPISLANRSVGVQFHQGSHYATLSMLEGFVSREQINVVHAGTVLERYESLMDGEIDAATLMEPWVTLAEKQGCKLLAGTFYQGTENASRSMSQELFEALMRSGEEGGRAHQRGQAAIPPLPAGRDPRESTRAGSLRRTFTCRIFATSTPCRIPKRSSSAPTTGC